MEEQTQSTTAEMPSILQRKIGHYVLLRELGRGGAATVYKALDTRDNSVVALKALASVPYSQDEDQMALLVRMERETRAVEGLSHPHIVRIIDVGFAGDSPENLIPYFAMEFLSGETLRQRMDRDGALPLSIAATILDQAADALDAVHASGIIHRDVKPGNLMLMKDNFVKLMDFGIARQNDDATITRAGMMVGSPAYMSPEQAVGESATAAADVWGLGVVLYEMVTGIAPFEGPNIPAILYQIRHGAPLVVPPTVPSSVGAVVLRALDRDPQKRFKRATDLSKAFRAAVEAPNSSAAISFAGAMPPPGPAMAGRQRKRSIHNRIALAYSVPIMVIAGVIAAILGTAALQSRMERTNQRTKPAATAKNSKTHVKGGKAASAVKRVAVKPAAKKSLLAPSKPLTAILASPAPSSIAIRPAVVPTPLPSKAPPPALAAAKKVVAAPHAPPVKPPMAHGSAQLAVTTRLSGASTPQPLPVPSVDDTPPTPAPDAEGDAPATPAPAPQDALLSGVWHGTYASHPALLILNRPSPDGGEFDGTLTVRLPAGAVVVDVHGRVGVTGRLRFREQKITSGPLSSGWSLGSVTGSVSASGALSGGGRADNGQAYGLDFHR